MNCEAGIASQMEQEKKILKRVLYIFSLSFIIGASTSLFLAMSSKKNLELLKIEACSDKKTLFAIWINVYSVFTD